ncbi:Signal transduction histidine kinase [Tenacibaculum sp. MAR_2010_89]|uniref:sensor histidine kinase n=1 Tax=Tenacibaculum sp. MAR_2010_89 TaxID=1250198 RepID=UPI00089CA535|nr:sensor histidine kinase [Tenacibaculum sp. MAR_2010_89]SEE59097.1 Signal transduction histidine kinase [Tenacibaculum sp. MAR_2010_89]
MSTKNKNTINFNFDISAYRLLGRELITDRITALFEIVKNSYDANADNVTISFENLIPYSNTNSKIIIKDDGIGMSLRDLKNKWMVIGTSDKRRERTSPSPYNRKVVGKKGIGRFAVDLLGSKLTLKTKQEGSDKWIYLETDWSKYVEIENQQLLLPFEDKKDYFTDIENKYWFEDAKKEEYGTTLKIERIQEWTNYDIERSYNELTKLVSPNFKIPPRYPFNIKIKSPFENFIDVKIKPNDVKEQSTISIELSYDEKSNTQQVIRNNNGVLEKINVPKKSFGLVDFTFHYFDLKAKKNIKKNSTADIDGIKIYRDGIITTPFAEYEDKVTKQKDIIGIDKRRYSGFFDKISSRDLLGFVELKDEKNPDIIEATNRQGFIENNEWRDLKVFIIEQIEQVELSFKDQRNKASEKTKSELGNANNSLKNLKTLVSNIKKEASPVVKEQLKTVQIELGKLQGTVSKSIKDYVRLEEETKQKENLYSSLVSLQTYAAMFSHMTKHTIGHVIRQAEYFSKYYPDTSKDSRFMSISGNIFEEFITLRDGVDFMLKYAKSDTDVEEIDLKDLLEILFNKIYKDVFFQEKIKIQLDIKKSIILNYNRKAIEDVFDNLISNSIKALKHEENKKIKCSSEIQKDKLIIYFSDNGIGINEEDKYKIFDIFFTKTFDDGGSGLGLYMVKTRIESMKGDIELIDNEFKPTGATFKIELPFKK